MVIPLYLFNRLPAEVRPSKPKVSHIQSGSQSIGLSDGDGNVRFHLNLQDGCVIDQLTVRGRQVESFEHPITSGFKVDGTWFTSEKLTRKPTVTEGKNQLKVVGVDYEGGGVRVSETWYFTSKPHSIDWKIDRKYFSSGTLEDTAMPKLSFTNMSTWTGAVLGTGGVAWGKLFDQPNASYGIHTNTATLWNPSLESCLKLEAKDPSGTSQALRFTREPGDNFSVTSEPTSATLTTKHDLSRFLKTRQDVWASFPVQVAQTESTTLSFSSPNYEETFGRGNFKGIDTKAVSSILNTIARIGDIDDRLMGSNGWYSGYICLHEPWIALMGLAIDDPKYTANYAKALDYSKAHAIQPDGMVKSRWCYGSYDATPGTYDKYGFYEAQWGRLMDTQTSYVTDVTDQFDESGNLAWMKGQKGACEAALQYLLRRDTKGNHLVEVLPDSMTQKKSSDWLDIVWASYENAFVNAQLYGTLGRFARVEHILGDDVKAKYYLDYAAKLKVSFNKPVSQGGFWNPDKGWYIYWREKDGSAHGDNLTLHVNLTALGVGLCDDPARHKELLNKIEAEMTKEKLLIWPSCMYPFAPGEGANRSFPEYENGDIFLAWAEYGIRAYAPTQPKVAIKYVKQIIDQYNKDGLAFQRYSRADGSGQGDDILANNCNAIVGLYRDIYGIQPMYNRLYLDPHLESDLNGTVVKYNLRGTPLMIGLATNHYSVTSNGYSALATSAFGVAFQKDGLTYFKGASDSPAFSIRSESHFSIETSQWTSQKSWLLTSSKKSIVTQEFYNLEPGSKYFLYAWGKKIATVSKSRPFAIFSILAGRATALKLVRA